MSDHPHAATYRQLSEGLQDGDMSSLAETIADDVEWWEIGASEPVRGKEALLERMSWMGDWDVSAELHDVVANDEHLIALLDVTASRGGETLSYRTAEIHHVNEAGQVTHRWAFSDDTQAIVDFFG